MRKILVLDDDPDILEAVKLILETEGYDVETTERPEHILNLNINNLPELIILDVLLSGKDGREIAKELKAATATKMIPIIMFSAHPNAEKTIGNIGVEDFIAKPFDMNELLQLVRKHIQ